MSSYAAVTADARLARSARAPLHYQSPPPFALCPTDRPPPVTSSAAVRCPPLPARPPSFHRSSVRTSPAVRHHHRRRPPSVRPSAFPLPVVAVVCPVARSSGGPHTPYSPTRRLPVTLRTPS